MHNKINISSFISMTTFFLFVVFFVYNFSGSVHAANGCLGDQIKNVSGDCVDPAPSSRVPGAINFKYRLLEQFPGFFQRGEVVTDLKTLISALYKFGVWTVGIAATLMLVIGGFMYMTSAGNTSKASSAKGVITDALIGLVVALSSYLLFYVINPDLTKMNFNIVKVGIEAVEIPPDEAIVPTSEQYSDAEARQILLSAGFSINKSNCSSRSQTNCTSLDGIPKKAIERIISLKRSCNCPITVTGGTEAGHQSHGVGKPMIDVAYSQQLANFLRETKTSRRYANYGISQVCTSDAEINLISYNRAYNKGCKDPSPEPHFHLSFGL